MTGGYKGGRVAHVGGGGGGFVFKGQTAIVGAAASFQSLTGAVGDADEAYITETSGASD